MASIENSLKYESEVEPGKVRLQGGDLGDDGDLGDNGDALLSPMSSLSPMSPTLGGKAVC